MHLAEYRVPDPPRTRNGSAIRTADGRLQWATWTDVDHDGADFLEVGRPFDAAMQPRVGEVGSARCILATQRDVVDFAVEWMTRHRRTD